MKEQEQISSNDTIGAASTGLRIAYPTRWIVNDQDNGTVRFSTHFIGDLMRFTVNVSNLPSALQRNMSMDRLVDINLKSLKQELSNFTLIESNQTAISSKGTQTVHKMVYTNTNKNPNFPLSIKSMQIFAIKDCQACIISYVLKESRFKTSVYNRKND